MATPGTCAHCGNASPQLRCSHLEPDGSQSFTLYCGKECQTANWPTHKDSCKHSRQRVRLHQAAALLKGILIPFCELAVSWNIVKVDVKEDGTLRLYEGKKAERQFLGFKLDRFPHLDELQKEAIISYKSSRQFLDALGWLAEACLQGIGTGSLCTVNIKETKVKILMHEIKTLDSTLQPTSHFQEFPPHKTHVVITTRLSDGIEYAIDPFGACLHAQSPGRVVFPWLDYQQEFVEEIVKTAPAPTTIPMAMIAHPCPNPDEQWPNCYIRGTSTALRQTIPRTVFAAALKLSGPKFEAEKTRLIKQAVDRFSQSFEGAGKICGAYPITQESLKAEMEQALHVGKALAKEDGRVLEVMRSRYGADAKLVQLTSRAKETGADDDYAEAGHRAMGQTLGTALKEKVTPPF